MMKKHTRKAIKRGTKVRVNRYPSAPEKATVVKAVTVKVDGVNLHPNNMYLLQLKSGELLSAHRTSFRVI